MHEIIPSNFDDQVQNLVIDLEGHDDDFYRERAKMTIAWWIGRAKSIEEASAEIRKPARGQFIKAVCSRYVNRDGKPYFTERRAYEALEVYKRFARHGEADVRSITNRIYEELGNWSAALPSKKEEEAVVEETCRHHCPTHP